MTQFLDCRLNLEIGSVCHTEHERESSRAAGARYFLIFFCLKSFFTSRRFPHFPRRREERACFTGRAQEGGKQVS